MTTTSNNKFDQLLDYLDSHEKIKETPTKVIKQKNSEQKHTISMLEDAKIHSFIPKNLDASITQSLGFNVKKFTSMMRSKLIEEHKKLQSYERPYISVTELCGCIRACYYNRMRYSVNVNKLYQYPYLYLIQKVGNEIHNVIQTVYDFSEVEKTVVSEKFKAKGRVDAIRENFLYDIKSIDVDKFQNKYINEHYIQANIYSYILNSEYDYKIDTITIIYVMRNLKRIVPFDLPVNKSEAETFLNLALILKSSIEKIQVVDPYGASLEICKYCNFKEQCEEDKPKEIVQPFLINKIKKENTREDNGKSAFLL